MLITEWKSHFEPRIIVRGDHINRIPGSIENVEVENKRVSATVHGTEDYHVEIATSSGGSFLDAECTCPYAGKCGFCKHEAALIMRINAEEDARLNEARKGSFLRSADEAVKVLDTVDENAMKEFLITVFRENEKAAVRFVEDHISPEDTETSQEMIRRDLLLTVNSWTILDEGEMRVPSEDAWELMRELKCVILYNLDRYEVRGAWMDAFRTVETGFRMMIEFDRGDYCVKAITPRYSGFAVERWKDMVRDADTESRKAIYERMDTLIKDGISESLRNALLEVLWSSFSEELRKRNFVLDPVR